MEAHDKSGRGNKENRAMDGRNMKFLPYGLHWIDEQDIEEVVKILRSDWIVMGSKVKEFENAVCNYVGSKHGIAVNSGTAALDIAVNSLEIDTGEVITTPFTFVATAHSILYAGLKPIFADIQRDTFNIDPSEVEKKINKNTKAMIYVDFAGHPCEIEELKRIARQNDLWLIEDAAHALGAEYKGKKIGSFADITIFSFHPVKHITTGEGGMCVTNDDELAEKMRILRNQGVETAALERFGPHGRWTYDVKMLGRNYRMTDFQAALGLSQFKKLDFFLKRREEIAKIYMQELADAQFLEPPVCRPCVRHAWHIFTVLVDRRISRDKFIIHLREKGIGVTVHYTPIYRFSYYGKRFNFRPEDFPVTEDVSERIVTLPLFPKMTDEDVMRVVSAVRDAGREIVR
ncbi:MAG: UDP-4-amino-4,6-dideoxy-N-acetyl-beta-L-altrosamine transaminase [Candidatus Hadarchaeales archaeon]